jgi:uncharacterized protein (DUF302 family)
MTYRSNSPGWKSRAGARITFGLAAVALTAGALAAPAAAERPAAQVVAQPATPGIGVLRIKSAYGFDETVTRLKADVAAKGIRFFDEIDQSQLGAGANIPLRPTKLLLFGNPPLGVHFLTANPYAGLDWPVRMLVVQEPDGQVYVAYTDFAFIARRYAISNREAEFKMATAVSASIASSVTARP